MTKTTSRTLTGARLAGRLATLFVSVAAVAVALGLWTVAH